MAPLLHRAAINSRPNCESYCRPILLDPLLNQYEVCNGTMVLPFSERILLAERIIYVIVASLLAWFVFEVRVTFIVS